MSVVMFDLYGTLVEEEEYDYNRALRWMADTYFDARFEELQDLSCRFKTAYMRTRAVSNAETSFRAQLVLFETALNRKLQDDYQAVEAGFIKIFRRERLKDGAASLLRMLYDRGTRTYVLTNSLFSGENLKAHLVTIGIGDLIEAVYSSADAGYRKPSPEVFRYALTNIGIRDVGQVIYVGDSYEKDYLGACASGLQPVLVSSYPEYADIAFANLWAVESYLGRHSRISCVRHGVLAL
ncbi:MAG: HAD family hydrolase [Kiritimatiellae bacterium]|nr:HAD family hydrolase [Kiritimatiellia bacterium]